MGKNPSFQYYPKDWRADPVFGCSLAARGLWHEMMGLMHDSPRYGYLCDKQRKPIPQDLLAQLCGTTTEEFAVLLAELYRAGVPRRTASGVIFSKRMVRDEQRRREWRKKWSTKRGNRSATAFENGPSVHKTEEMAASELSRNSRLLSSSSSSSSQNLKEKPGRLPAPVPRPPPGSAENQKPPPTKYAAIHKLIVGAEYLMSGGNGSAEGADLSEDLKCWAAENNVAYDSEAVDIAISIAQKRFVESEVRRLAAQKTV